MGELGVVLTKGTFQGAQPKELPEVKETAGSSCTVMVLVSVSEQPAKVLLVFRVMVYVPGVLKTA
ncbi:MAG: hypothetical protein ACO1O6_07700 [Bacteroidota bacterium]